MNNGLWLNVSGGSTLNLAMDSSTVQGAALTAAGGTSNVTLRNNSLWTMTGNSNVTNLINGSSLVQFTPPVGDPTGLSSYKTLTAVNYIGRGGTLGLNTFLGTDGSPSDRLVINGGTATGNSLLKITNTTGPGAQTVANGIQVVQAINGGTTAPGAFALAGEVRGGAFDYFLFRGGLGGSSPNDWFLRSSFVVPPIEPPVEPQSADRATRPTVDPARANWAGAADRSAAGSAAAGCLSDHRAGDRDPRCGSTDRPTIGDDDARHLA